MNGNTHRILFGIVCSVLVGWCSWMWNVKVDKSVFEACRAGDKEMMNQQYVEIIRRLDRMETKIEREGRR